MKEGLSPTTTVEDVKDGVAKIDLGEEEPAEAATGDGEEGEGESKKAD